jgi:hypothetical protein
VVVLRRGIPTNDLACGPSSGGSGGGSARAAAAALAKESSLQQARCKVCGGAAAVAEACRANPGCVAFVMNEQKPGCGYLKAAATGQVDSATQVLYYRRRSKLSTLVSD